MTFRASQHLTCTSGQAPFTVHFRKLIVELQDELLVFSLIVTVEHVLIADSALLVDWHDVAVCVGCCLIQMHHKADDVLLTKLTGYKVIDVLCPLLNLWHPLDILIATFGFKIHLLIAKCQLSHAVMGTAEDELHGSTDVRVHTSDIRVFDAT